MKDNLIDITAYELTENEAFAFAQFLKRVGINDYKVKAYDDKEAYAMMTAGEKIREALSDKGFSPR